MLGATTVAISDKPHEANTQQRRSSRDSKIIGTSERTQQFAHILSTLQLKFSKRRVLASRHKHRY